MEQSQNRASRSLGIDGAAGHSRAVLIALSKKSLIRVTWGAGVSAR